MLSMCVFSTNYHLIIVLIALLQKIEKRYFPNNLQLILSFLYFQIIKQNNYNIRPSKNILKYFWFKTEFKTFEWIKLFEFILFSQYDQLFNLAFIQKVLTKDEFRIRKNRFHWWKYGLGWDRMGSDALWKRIGLVGKYTSSVGE